MLNREVKDNEGWTVLSRAGSKKIIEHAVLVGWGELRDQRTTLQVGRT